MIIAFQKRISTEPSKTFLFCESERGGSKRLPELRKSSEAHPSTRWGAAGLVVSYKELREEQRSWVFCKTVCLDKASVRGGEACKSPAKSSRL